MQCHNEVNKAQYREEVNNMLATIMETKREMEATGREVDEYSHFDL